MGNGWTGRRKACPVIRLAEGRETKGGEDEDTPRVRGHSEGASGMADDGFHAPSIEYNAARVNLQREESDNKRQRPRVIGGATAGAGSVFSLSESVRGT